MKMKDYLLTFAELRKEQKPVAKHRKEHCDVELSLNKTGRNDSTMRARISFYSKASELIHSYSHVACIMKNDQIVFFFLNDKPKGIACYKLGKSNNHGDKCLSFKLSEADEKVFRTKWAGKGYPVHLVSSEVDGGIEDGIILRIQRTEGLIK